MPTYWDKDKISAFVCNWQTWQNVLTILGPYFKEAETVQYSAIPNLKPKVTNSTCFKSNINKDTPQETPVLS